MDIKNCVNFDPFISILGFSRAHTTQAVLFPPLMRPEPKSKLKPVSFSQWNAATGHFNYGNPGLGLRAILCQVRYGGYFKQQDGYAPAPLIGALDFSVLIVLDSATQLVGDI